MQPNDRRKFQRLKLSKPILGLFGGLNALLLDVGLTGAFLEHYGEASAGERRPLVFRWQGAEISFLCEVTRTAVVRYPAGDGQSALSHSGVRFIEASGDSAKRLQDFITSFVARIITAQKSNAAGDQSGQSAGESILAMLGHAHRSRSHGYVCYRFEDNAWWREASDTPMQPLDGFTVGSHEDEDEIETLCRAYESADDEGRRLIRLVAELSTAKV